MNTVTFPDEAKEARWVVVIDGRDCDMRTTYNVIAVRFADLHSIEADLRMTYEAIELIINDYSNESAEKLRKFCWDSAVIRYRRCFISGVREIFSIEDLLSEIPLYRGFHEYLLNLGNKHIAHSVNLQEQTVPFVALLDENGVSRAEAHGIQRISAHVDNLENLHKLYGFVKDILARLVQEIEQLSTHFDSYVSELDSEALNQLPPLVLKVNPDKSALGKRR